MAGGHYLKVLPCQMNTVSDELEEMFMKPESTTHQNNNGSERKQQQQILDENDNRKRYSRFRSKNHVCDFCNKSFTLKHNVQTHMSLYHMPYDSVDPPIAAARKATTTATASTVKKQESFE